MSDHEHHESDHHPHVLPLSMYFGVAGGLIALTIATVFTAKFMPHILKDLTNGVIDIEGTVVAIIIAMIIACIKAGLVCGYFMHLRYDAPINRATFLSGLFFLALFFLFTMADTLTRDTKPNLYGIHEKTPEIFKVAAGKPIPKVDGKYQRVFKVKAKEGYDAAGYKLGPDGKRLPLH